MTAGAVLAFDKDDNFLITWKTNTGTNATKYSVVDRNPIEGFTDITITNSGDVLTTLIFFKTTNAFYASSNLTLFTFDSSGTQSDSISALSDIRFGADTAFVNASDQITILGTNPFATKVVLDSFDSSLNELWGGAQDISNTGSPSNFDMSVRSDGRAFIVYQDTNYY